MQLNLIGIDHTTAPLAIREKAAISSGKLADALLMLRKQIPYGVIVSTCNRTEIYVTEEETKHVSERAVLKFIEDLTGESYVSLARYLQVSKGADAAQHLFRVACGLESLIVGEFEILGQLGNALDAAEAANTVSLPLRTLFQSAIRTGRRVRNETGISKSALSVSSVAVKLAETVVGDLKTTKMVVIGTGEAGRLVAKVAGECGVPKIVIASRSKERAESIASNFHGTAVDLDNLDQELEDAGIIVTCAGAPHHILHASRICNIMKHHAGAPLVIIDIAVPRNVEPEVGQIENVYLHNIDNLNEIAKENSLRRKSDIQSAEKIIKEELDNFMAWWQTLDVRPLVTALMGRAEQIRLAQLGKTLKKLPALSEEQMANLEAMTKSIVTLILRDPIHYLNANGENDRLEVVKEVFRLNGDQINEN